MKPKYWAIIILAAIATSVTVLYYAKQPVDLEPIVVHHDAMKGWKTYANSEYEFEFQHPESWEVKASSIDLATVFTQFKTKDGHKATFYIFPFSTSKINTWAEWKARHHYDFSREIEIGNKQIVEGFSSFCDAADGYEKACSSSIDFNSDSFFQKVLNFSLVVDNTDVLPVPEGMDIYDRYKVEVYIIEQILSTFKFTSPQTDISTWKTYTNSQYEFEVKYPPGWKIIEEKKNVDNTFSFFIMDEKKKELPFNITVNAKTKNYGASRFPSLPVPDSAIDKQILSTFKFTSPQTDISTWKTYTNKSFGYEFKYPPSLYFDTGNENSGTVELRISKIDELIGGASDPKGVEGKDWTANGYFIQVGVQDYAKEFVLDDWLKNRYPNSIFQYKKKISISGIDSYEFATAEEIGAGEPKVIVPYNGKLYIISYASDSSNVDKEGLIIYNQILSTFELIK